MIQLNEIKLENFLSHDSTVIKIEPSDKLLLAGNSGSGKSSILDAVIFALYGKGRSDTNKGLIRIGKKEAEVTVSLQDNETTYIVKRGINTKGKQTLDITESLDGTTYAPIASVGLKDSQLWLEKTLLKSSYLLFINSIACPQDNADNFVKQTAAKRKELLLEIIDTADFDLYYNRAKTELALVEEKITRTEANITGYLVTIKENEGIAADIINITEALEELQAKKDRDNKNLAELRRRKEEFSNIANTLKSIQQDISSSKIAIEKNENLIIDKLNKVEQIRSIDAKKLESDVAQLGEAIFALQNLELLYGQERQRQQDIKDLLQNKPSTYSLDSDINSLSDEMMTTILDNSAFCEFIGKTCPKLEGAREKKIADLETRIKTLTDVQDANKKEWSEYNIKMEALVGSDQAVPVDYNDIVKQKSVVDQLKKSESELATLNVKRDYAVSLEKECQSIQTESVLLEGSIKELKEKLELESKLFNETEFAVLSSKILEGESQVNRYALDINAVTHKLGWAESSKKAMNEAVLLKEAKENELSILRVKKDQLALVKEAFGSKGIKTIIIDYILPRLEAKINNILSRLSDFTVSLDTQKTSSDGDGTVEGLFINIFNEKNQQMSYENYSGGESMKIRYSIFEALATFQRCGFRLLDEHILGLHEDMLDKFSNIMLSLDKKNTQVICISHLQGIKDKFSNIITVEKKGGISMVL